MDSYAPFIEVRKDVTKSASFCDPIQVCGIYVLKID